MPRVRFIVLRPLPPIPGGGQDGSTWIDRLLPLVVAASPAVRELASFVLDSRQTVVDVSFRVVLITDGNAARNAQIMTIAISLALSLHLILGGLRRGQHPFSWIVAPAFVILLSQFLRGSIEFSSLIGLGTALLVLLAAGFLRVDRRSIHYLAIWAIGFTMSTWITFLVAGDTATKECREDKCSPLGVLLTGFMPHENILGLYVAFLIPALAVFSWRPRFVSVLLLVSTIAATGSRTAAASAVLGIVGMHVLRRTWLAPNRQRPISAVARAMTLGTAAAPVGATLVSLAVFFLTPPDGLTQRGAIYAILREELKTSPMYGAGSQGLEQAYYSTRIGYLVPHPHSHVGYLLATGGFLAFGFFLFAMVRLWWIGSRPGGWHVAAFAVAPSLSFATEDVWSYNVSNSFLWTVVVTTALYSNTARSHSGHYRSRLAEVGRNACRTPTGGD